MNALKLFKQIYESKDREVLRNYSYLKINNYDEIKVYSVDPKTREIRDAFYEFECVEICNALKLSCYIAVDNDQKPYLRIY